MGSGDDGDLDIEPDTAAATGRRFEEDDHTEEVPKGAPAVGRGRSQAAANLASRPVPDALARFYNQDTGEDLTAFGDYDNGRGDGTFIADQLDRVDLGPVAAPVALGAASTEQIIEMSEADAAAAAAQRTININFSGPRLRDDEAEHKVKVISELLEAVVQAIDAELGPGTGLARVQVLLEGTSGVYATLFSRVELHPTGRLPVERVLRNLRKRSNAEQRNLLNGALLDVADRCLQLASTSLTEDSLDALLQRVAGFQARFGI
jgi:hypothetical protein